MQYDYLIVGTGLYGATIAYMLKKENPKCKILMLDKRPHIGGNCFTYESKGIIVHKYGAHIFHTNDEEVWNLVNSITEFDSYINSPLAYYKGEYYNLPINMNTFRQIYKTTDVETIKRLIEQDKVFEEGDNLESHILSMVGKEIYYRIFKSYTEKQWGRPCSELPSSIVKRVPIRYEFNNNYFNDHYQGIPAKGYTALIKGLIKGCDVDLDVDYNLNRGYYNSLAEKIIYTGTIDSLFDYQLGSLDYRSVKFVDQVFDKNSVQKSAVINYTDKDFKYTRSIEHRKFQRDCDSDCSIVSYEYPVAGDVNEPYYPINNEKNNELYEKYKKLLNKKNFFIGGRLGDYKYYDMDVTIAMAIKQAKEVMSHE